MQSCLETNSYLVKCQTLGTTKAHKTNREHELLNSVRHNTSKRGRGQYAKQTF